MKERTNITSNSLEPANCWAPGSDAGQHLQGKGNGENCQICGQSLEYLNMGKELNCCQCGKNEIGNISCPQGHYICDICHGKGVYEELLRQILGASSSNPFTIAEELMNNSRVPMLGCENAWIAAGAFLAAIRNESKINVTDEQIIEALNRTRKQAIGGYCGLTGICGIAPAIGACFSIILGAACPKDKETATTMKIAGKIVNAIAEQTGPCCCKNFVRTALKEATISAKEYLEVNLPNQVAKIECHYSWRHPHGCREEKCPYFNYSNNAHL